MVTVFCLGMCAGCCGLALVVLVWSWFAAAARTDRMREDAISRLERQCKPKIVHDSQERNDGSNC